MNLLIALAFTAVSGALDAIGFVHATRVWHQDHLVWKEAGVAFAGFVSATVVYLLVVRYLARCGMTTPTVQTLSWFLMTVIGVALLQRTIAQWSVTDRLAMLLAVLSVGWLVVRQRG
jgi:hypothetical protein